MSFYTSLSGLKGAQTDMSVISNNIANMTTTGYKRRRPEFQDLLYQSQRRIGAQSSSQGTVVPAGVQLGLGVKTAAVYREPRALPALSRAAKLGRRAALDVAHGQLDQLLGVRRVARHGGHGIAAPELLALPAEVDLEELARGERERRAVGARERQDRKSVV